MKQEYDFDTVLRELGTFGKYQQKNFILLSFVIAFSAMALSFVFITRSSNYRCYIPECDPPNIHEATYNVSWFYNVFPEDSALCQRYEAMDYVPKCEANYFRKDSLQRCEQFVFENGDATIEKDFNLTCKENLWKLSFVGSLGDFSEILGLPLVGYISDKYGRRNVMIIGCVASAFFGVSKSFAPSYESFLTFEFFETMVGAGVFSAAYILTIELVTPAHRVFCSTLLICMFSLGEAYLCLIAWLTQSWRPMLRILHFPAVFFLLYYYHLNESVRWLLVKGKTAQAKQILRDLAKTNKISVSPHLIESVSIGVNDLQNGGRESILRVFQSPILCMRFLFCAFVWLTCTFVFYGFNMKSVMISGNLYLNYLISVLIEIPANLLCYLLLNGRRRKPVLCSSLFSTGLLCFILLISQLGCLEIIIFALGKCCISISMSTIYIYAAEVFPTSVRHSLFACCSIAGRIGGMAAPQIPLMAAISPSFVYALFMCMTITSSALVLTFPESYNTKLPDTVSQAAQIGKQ